MAGIFVNQWKNCGELEKNHGVKFYYFACKQSIAMDLGKSCTKEGINNIFWTEKNYEVVELITWDAEASRDLQVDHKWPSIISK